MSEYSKYMEQAKKEVKLCIKIWKGVLEEKFEEEIEYAFAKGSAMKEWDTFIDYVPTLSDVDIHIKIKENVEFFDDETSFYESVKLPELYEERYIELNPEFLHIPQDPDYENR